MYKRKSIAWKKQDRKIWKKKKFHSNANTLYICIYDLRISKCECVYMLAHTRVVCVRNREREWVYVCVCKSSAFIQKLFVSVLIIKDNIFERTTCNQNLVLKTFIMTCRIYYDKSYLLFIFPLSYSLIFIRRKAFVYKRVNVNAERNFSSKYF